LRLSVRPYCLRTRRPRRDLRRSCPPRPRRRSTDYLPHRRLTSVRRVRRFAQLPLGERHRRPQRRRHDLGAHPSTLRRSRDLRRRRGRPRRAAAAPNRCRTPGSRAVLRRSTAPVARLPTHAVWA